MPIDVLRFLLKIDGRADIHQPSSLLHLPSNCQLSIINYQLILNPPLAPIEAIQRVEKSVYRVYLPQMSVALHHAPDWWVALALDGGVAEAPGP